MEQGLLHPALRAWGNRMTRITVIDREPAPVYDAA
jgi:hypothetical protein